MGHGGWGEEDTNKFVFSALRGIQAGQEFYVVMCPLSLIPKVFLFNEPGIPVEWRAQRTLNKARIPEIGKYLLNNSNEYVLSSLTVSIDGEVEFEPTGKAGHELKMGTLKIPMDARFLINDGQHRRAAIEWALRENPELGRETISVVFFLDKGLKKSQQMFTDLNKHAVKPTKSLSILYDHRDDFSKAMRQMILQVPIFANLTELEKTSISNRKHKVFTLSGIYQATKLFLDKRQKQPTITSEEQLLARQYWSKVYANMKDWKDIVSGKSAPHVLRKSSVNVHGIILNALGLLGRDLLQQEPAHWKKYLQNLNSIDWRKDNHEWEGRAMIGGRLTKVQMNVKLTANLLKMKLGIPLTDEDRQLEEKIGNEVDLYV